MKFVFIIQAFESRDPAGQIMDVCTLEFFCKTPDEALKKAKEMIKKKFYRIKNVIEKEA